MIGFELLLAHLVGDYIFQNDWMAKWKVAEVGVIDSVSDPRFPAAGYPCPKNMWMYNLRPFLACTIHCLLYTLSVWCFTWYWMAWWGFLICFGLHWVIDRFRLARKWMENVSGQKAFANGPLSPWSIVVVDNVFHLLTLYGIWLLHSLTKVSP